MKFDVIVLGAGITGVTTAYYLQQKGYKVAVIDRQDKSGEETSFANGGQISPSHAEPWANPSAPLQVLKWLTNKNSPLYFSPKLDIHQWNWILKWLFECRTSKCDSNTVKLTQLAIESKQELDLIRNKHKFKFDHLSKGILHYYRDQKSLDNALRAADKMRSAGLEIIPVNRDELIKLEPALIPRGWDIIGGTYAPGDQSGDAYKFCQEMTYYLQEMGVKFFFNTGVIKTYKDGHKTTSLGCVDTNDNDKYFFFDIECSSVVVCLGSFSYQFVKSNYNVSLDIYPAKGSSITVPIKNTDYVPIISLTDDENKLVFSRLGNRLRVAGTAELSGWDSTINVDRCKVVLEKAKFLFEEGCNWDEVEFWSGLRPTTPSNLPYVSRLDGTSNVYLNTGHGTLGWTLSCGSAKTISSILHNSQGLSR